MKAISVKQPWASLIVHGIKDIENRTWVCPQKYIGHRVLIHASLKGANFWDSPVAGRVDEFIREISKSGTDWSNYPNGAIIGSVKIVDCVQNHSSVWAEKGVLNWVLSDPILFDKPIPAKGKLSFWEYKEIISMGYHGLKEGMIVDFLLGDEWKIGYGTILYFDDNSGKPVVEMNYPGHDGCRWAHEYSLDSIRPSAL